MIDYEEEIYLEPEEEEEIVIDESESEEEIDIEDAESVNITVNHDYNNLENKPSINSVTLQGTMSLESLGLRGVLYNTKEGWNAQSSLVAEEGTIYIYSNYSTKVVDGITKNVPGIKIGDGTSYLIDMPFMNEDFTDQLMNHINNALIHVTPAEKTFWNNKSSAFMDPSTEETLVLSNTSYMLGGTIHDG